MLKIKVEREANRALPNCRYEGDGIFGWRNFYLHHTSQGWAAAYITDITEVEGEVSKSANAALHSLRDELRIAVNMGEDPVDVRRGEVLLDAILSEQSQ